MRNMRKGKVFATMSLYIKKRSMVSLGEPEL